MICPHCAKPMVEDGEWPFTDQKTGMTFQVMGFRCAPCDIYVMKGMDR